VAVLLMPLSPLHAADDTLDAMLAGLAQHPHGEVSFSEETRSHLLTRPLHSAGILRFDAPDRLEKQTQSPAAEDLIVAGDTVTIARAHHQSSIRLSDYPELSSLLEGIRATLGGNRASLEQHFQVTFQPASSGWELRLAPLPQTTHPGFRIIVIRGHNDVLENVTLEQPNGDRTLIALSPPASG
jgi:hypothetical protein